MFSPCKFDHDCLNAKGFYLQGSCADGSVLCRLNKSDVDFSYSINKKVEKFFHVENIESNPDQPAYVKIKGTPVTPYVPCSFIKYQNGEEAELDIKELRQTLTTKLKQQISSSSPHLFVKAEMDDISCYTVQFYNSFHYAQLVSLKHLVNIFLRLETYSDIKSAVKQLLKEISGNYVVMSVELALFLNKLTQFILKLDKNSLSYTSYVGHVDRLCELIWEDFRKNLSTKNVNKYRFKIVNHFKKQTEDIFNEILSFINQTTVEGLFHLDVDLISTAIFNKIHMHKNDELKCIIQEVWKEQKRRLFECYSFELVNKFKAQIKCNAIISRKAYMSVFGKKGNIKSLIEFIKNNILDTFMQNIKEYILRKRESIWNVNLIIKEIIMESNKRINGKLKKSSDAEINSEKFQDEHLKMTSGSSSTVAEDHLTPDNVEDDLLLFVKDIMTKFNTDIIEDHAMKILTDGATKTLMDLFNQSFDKIILKKKGKVLGTKDEAIFGLQKDINSYLKNVIDKYCLEKKKYIQSQLKMNCFATSLRTKICLLYINNYINIIINCVYNDVHKIKCTIYGETEKFLNVNKQQNIANETFLKIIDGILSDWIINPNQSIIEIAVKGKQENSTTNNNTIKRKKLNKCEIELHNKLLFITTCVPNFNTVNSYMYNHILDITNKIFFDIITSIALCGMPQIVDMIKNKITLIGKNNLTVINFVNEEIEDLYKSDFNCQNAYFYFQKYLLEICSQMLMKDNENKFTAPWVDPQHGSHNDSVFNFRIFCNIIRKSLEKIIIDANKNIIFRMEMNEKNQFQTAINLLTRNDLMKVIMLRLYLDYKKKYGQSTDEFKVENNREMGYQKFHKIHEETKKIEHAQMSLSSLLTFQYLNDSTEDYFECTKCLTYFTKQTAGIENHAESSLTKTLIHLKKYLDYMKNYIKPHSSQQDTSTTIKCETQKQNCVKSSTNKYSDFDNDEDDNKNEFTDGSNDNNEHENKNESTNGGNNDEDENRNEFTDGSDDKNEDDNKNKFTDGNDDNDENENKNEFSDGSNDNNEHENKNESTNGSNNDEDENKNEYSDGSDDNNEDDNKNKFTDGIDDNDEGDNKNEFINGSDDKNEDENKNKITDGNDDNNEDDNKYEFTDGNDDKNEDENENKFTDGSDDNDENDNKNESTNCGNNDEDDNKNEFTDGCDDNNEDKNKNEYTNDDDDNVNHITNEDVCANETNYRLIDVNSENRYDILFRVIQMLLINYENHVTNNKLPNHKIEIVPCLSFPGWPPEANNWKLRQRCWPSNDFVQKIFSIGYQIVFKSCKTDRMYDGRISFSAAEGILCEAMTECQKKVYNHLKIRYTSKIFKSYYIKTCCFWVFEETPYTCENIENVYIEKSFAKVMDALCCGNLPHFFIPEHNLFQNIKEEKLHNGFVYLNEVEEISKLFLDSQHYIFNVSVSNTEAFLSYSKQILKASICPLFENLIL